MNPQEQRKNLAELIESGQLNSPEGLTAYLETHPEVAKAVKAMGETSDIFHSTAEEQRPNLINSDPTYQNGIQQIENAGGTDLVRYVRIKIREEIESG